MPLPTYIPGQVLTASDCSLWFIPIVVVKPSDQSVTSSTTLVNDTALVAAVAANATYRVELMLEFQAAGPGTGDIKWSWTVPAGASMHYTASYRDTSLNPQVGNRHIESDVFGAGGSGANNLMAEMRGNLTVAGTSGNLTLQWAQNTSSATATIVRARSHLILTRIG